MRCEDPPPRAHAAAVNAAPPHDDHTPWINHPSAPRPPPRPAGRCGLLGVSDGRANTFASLIRCPRSPAHDVLAWPDRLVCVPWPQGVVIFSRRSRAIAAWLTGLDLAFVAAVLESRELHIEVGLDTQ